MSTCFERQSASLAAASGIESRRERDVATPEELTDVRRRLRWLKSYAVELLDADGWEGPLPRHHSAGDHAGRALLVDAHGLSAVRELWRREIGDAESVLGYDADELQRRWGAWVEDRYEPRRRPRARPRLRPGHCGLVR